MAITVGTRIGAYQVLTLLGAGGMGEVYRARDTKLDRVVALKVLPPGVARSRERLTRFEREARLLASLNHSNIAQVFGLEDSDGSPAIVMELVEGRTLDEWIRTRASRSRASSHANDVAVIARQIAEALESAHEQGIIHRDLKPANIRIRDDGVVKLLDFGLAKLLDPVVDADRATDAPTMTGPATEAGAVMGTVPYMSPEQVRGGRVDRRTDIWAFGCVLFEMLTGRRAFAGATTADVLAGVLHTDPDWSALPSEVPPAIARLLRRSLSKDEGSRLQAIGDARIELEEWESDPSPVAEVARTDSAAGVRPGLTAIGMAFVLGSVITAGAFWLLRPSRTQSPSTVTRLSLALPGIDALAGGSLGSILAVAPDGRTIVFAGVSNGLTRLYWRPLDGAAPTAIAGTEGAQDPFFSPDGTRVAFAASGKLRVVRPGSDNAPAIVCDVARIGGGSWGPDDTIVFGTESGLASVPASGGTPTPLTTLGPKDLSHSLPDFLPGGSALLFYIDRGNEDVIAAYSLADGTIRELTPGQAVRYSPTGHLVVLRGEDLWAMAFDVGALRVTGDAVQLGEHPRSTVTGGGMHFGIGGDGTLVYVTPAVQPANVPVWLDPAGGRSPLAIDPAHYQDVVLAPDGTRAALTTEVMAPGRAPGVLWVYDVGRRTSLRLAGSADNAAGSPVWSPDGRTIAYTGWVQDRGNIFMRAADGTRPADQFTDGPGYRTAQFWTPDGKAIVITTIRPGSADPDLSMFLLDDRTERALLATSAVESNAALSRDGRFMAYQSDESGRTDVHVRPFPDVDSGHWVISAEGGESPRWSPSGHALYYRSGRRIMVVPVETAPAFRAGEATVYVDNPLTLQDDPRLSFLFQRRNYDVAPDGRRLIILEDVRGSDDATMKPGIAVVLNWSATIAKTEGQTGAAGRK